MTTPTIPTEEQVLGWFDSLSNWGRWGDDDELGTLNLITEAKRQQAAGLVTEGISVTCSRLLVPEMAPDVTSIPPLHYMVSTGESAPSEGGGGASDFLGVSFHGLTVTHLDSLCHQFWNGKMYNGQDAGLVNNANKAGAGAVDAVKNGVVTRGVLLDIAGVKGKDWLDAGEPVFTADLEAAEEAQGVRVTEGDALCIRLGWHRRRQEVGPPTAAEGRPRPARRNAALDSGGEGYPSPPAMLRGTLRPASIPTWACPSTRLASSAWDCGSSTRPTSTRLRRYAGASTAGISCSPWRRCAGTTPPARR